MPRRCASAARRSSWRWAKRGFRPSRRPGRSEPTPMPLPIIIEQTARWYWIAVPLAAIPALVVLAGLFSLIKKRETPRLVRLAVLVPFALWAGWFLLAPVGWQMHFDK